MSNFLDGFYKPRADSKGRKFLVAFVGLIGIAQWVKRNPVQHPKQFRPTAAEAADEEGEEARAFYHHTRPSGHGG